ncbi:MAG: protein tyrosine phosphatase family protein [Proteobacteria bacterium]|nr:protein tyrosine phosphatase family protein [Pseudomonadota bacterium]
MLKAIAAFLLLVCAPALLATAADLDEISNFRVYSPQFASAGQPTARQLKLVRDAGYERVIYLAFTNDNTAIDDEDGTVKKLGMDYVHIAVDFDDPTSSDFYAFVGVIRTGPPQKTLLHCQVNFRASTFSFLYRTIYEGVDVADAKEDLDSVWQPNSTWQAFIFEVLEDFHIDPQCDVCDWAPDED